VVLAKCRIFATRKEQKYKHLKTNTMTTLTVRQIRRILFETNLYTVIGAEEMTNKESRDFLYAIEDQDEVYNVIDNRTHLLIWK